MRPAPEPDASCWLSVDDGPRLPLEVATTRRSRARGLLGRPSIDRPLLLLGVRSVHTIGMRFAIDVAWCDRDLRIVATRLVVPGRVTLPRRRAVAVLEAEAGWFEQRGVGPGAALRFGGSSATAGPWADQRWGGLAPGGGGR